MSFLARLTDFDTDTHAHVPSDFQKRYLETYMKRDNELIYCYGQDGHSYYFRYVKTGEQFVFRRGDLDLNITPHLPKVGYYNVEGVPVFLFKNPQKQYKRSMCYSVYTTDSTMLRAMGREQLRLYWNAIALATINPEYAHLDDIKKKILGFVAINSKFAIKDDRLIYRKYPIGMLDFNKREVEVTQPILIQEVMDLFKYTGVQTWMLR